MPDVFISYAHRDNQTPRYEPRGWVDCFYDALKARLDAIRGADTEVWRDQSDGRLTGSSLLTSSIKEALQECGVLLVIMSPAYLASKWCERELAYFEDAAEASGGLRVGTSSRIVKVVKLPVSGNLPATRIEEVADVMGYEFFYKTARGAPLEFDPPHGSEAGTDFCRAVNDLAFDLAAILAKRAGGTRAVARATPSSGATVYLAETTSEIKAYREAMRRELEQFGHTVLPAVDHPHAADYAERIREDIARAGVSIHMIGESYGARPERSDDSVVEIQYRAAAEEERARPGFRRIVWLQPGLIAAEERQHAFISRLQDDPQLASVSLEELKRLAHEALKPPPAPRVVTQNGEKSVYLIFDPPDRDAAKPIDDWLFSQGLEVLKPSSSSDMSERRLIHTHHLRTSDAVVIYHGHTSESWLVSKLSDLEKVYGQGRARKGKRPRAVILADPATSDKKEFRSHLIRVVPGFGGFSPEDLHDFVDELAALQSGAA